VGGHPADIHGQSALASLCAAGQEAQGSVQPFRARGDRRRSPLHQATVAGHPGQCHLLVQERQFALQFGKAFRMQRRPDVIHHAEGHDRRDEIGQGAACLEVAGKQDYRALRLWHALVESGKHASGTLERSRRRRIRAANEDQHLRRVAVQPGKGLLIPVAEASMQRDRPLQAHRGRGTGTAGAVDTQVIGQSHDSHSKRRRCAAGGHQRIRAFSGSVFAEDWGAITPERALHHVPQGLDSAAQARRDVLFGTGQRCRRFGTRNEAVRALHPFDKGGVRHGRADIRRDDRAQLRIHGHPLLSSADQGADPVTYEKVQATGKHNIER